MQLNILSIRTMSSKTQMLFSCTLRQEKPVWRIGPPLAWACSRLEVMSLAHQEDEDARTHDSSVRDLPICVFSRGASPWCGGRRMGRAVAQPVYLHPYTWRLMAVSRTDRLKKLIIYDRIRISLWSSKRCVRSLLDHGCCLIPKEIPALWK